MHGAGSECLFTLRHRLSKAVCKYQNVTLHCPLRRDNEDIDPAKVLMGLNFYGNMYKALGEGGPIIGHEYLDILDRDRPPLHWCAPEAISPGLSLRVRVRKEGFERNAHP